MKEKILKAIDKGLMNALSTDITDQDIDFNHDDIDNEYILHISIEDLYDTFKECNGNIFGIKYDTTDAVSLILYGGMEISLYEYEPGMYVQFVKISNDAMKASGNEILIDVAGHHWIDDISKDLWQLKEMQMQPDKYLIGNESDAVNDYDGYGASERIMTGKGSKKIPPVEYCRKCKMKGYQGYLPAAGQMKVITDYIDMINYVFRRIGSEEIQIIREATDKVTGYWWTSSEQNKDTVWIISCGELETRLKKYMRCAVLPLFKKIK